MDEEEIIEYPIHNICDVCGEMYNIEYIEGKFICHTCGYYFEEPGCRSKI